MLLSLVILALLAGPAVHLGIFIKGEWHLKVPRIITLHAIAYWLIWLFISPSTSGLLRQVQDASCVFSAYALGIFASIGVYRAFYHPLCKFPGPRMAALTKFWHVWQQRHGRNHTVLDSLKSRYGRFVRTGPNEITIFHPAAISIFDTPKTKTLRTDWYDVLHPRISTIFTRSETEHAARRRTWSAALSTKSIRDYHPRIRRHVEKLVDLIEKHGHDPVLLNDVMAWFSFDSMGDFLFSEGFGMMDSSTWHQAIIQQKRALQFLAPLNDTIWIVHMALSMFPFVNKVRDWNAMVSFCDQSAKRRMDTEAPDLDIASWFIREYDELESTRSLEDRQRILSGSIVTAVVAGSDTTRPTLIDIFYFLARYPRHAQKIFSEVRDVDLRTDDIGVLAAKPHLNAVIDESMRLLPAAMTGANRLTGDEGLWIDDTFIPPGVRVAAPKYSTMRLEEAFEQPDDFIPERWTTRPELVKDPRAFVPFGFGFRQCVGKTLALVEIRLVVACLVQRYEVEFAPGQDVESVVTEIRDYVTQQPGPCRVLFRKRKHGSVL